MRNLREERGTDWNLGWSRRPITNRDTREWDRSRVAVDGVIVIVSATLAPKRYSSVPGSLRSHLFVVALATLPDITATAATSPAMVSSSFCAAGFLWKNRASTITWRIAYGSCEQSTLTVYPVNGATGRGMTVVGSHHTDHWTLRSRESEATHHAQGVSLIYWCTGISGYYGKVQEKLSLSLSILLSFSHSFLISCSTYLLQYIATCRVDSARRNARAISNL